MARIPRIIVPKAPHLIVQYGLENQPIFDTELDRRQFLSRLNLYRREYQLDILAYSLMDDGVYLVVYPKSEESLAKTLRQTNSSFGRYMNRNRKSSGKFFRDRYLSAPLDTKWGLYAIHFVERMPIQQGLVKLAHQFKWGSAPGHCSNRAKDEVISCNWAGLRKIVSWKSWLNQKMSAEDEETLLSHVRRGFPLGNKAFLNKLVKSQVISEELGVQPQTPSSIKSLG